MKLSEFKVKLRNLETLTFSLENGENIPAHFHITEIGQITKRYIDCGGKIRNEEQISMQIWYSSDTEHRLVPRKLINIIALSERKLAIGDFDIYIEYQGNTIGKYQITFQDEKFILIPTKTTCLAQDHCGIDIPETKIENTAACCSPGGNCC